MASPVIALTLEAVERGYLDLSGFDYSPRWWAGHRLAINRADQKLSADIARAKLTAITAQGAELDDPAQKTYKVLQGH